MATEFFKKDFSEEELVDIARRRIKAKRELFSHMAAYLFVNLFLMFVYFVGTGLKFNIMGSPWFVWVLGGWGLGLAFHIFETIQELNFKYNAGVVEKELSKIKKKLESKQD